MNRDVPDCDGSILYYDGDYPSLELGAPTAETVRTLARMGLLGDIPFYLEQAVATGGPVLELGCGTGRLAIPLARAGLEVWALDSSAAMLDQLRTKLAAEPQEVRARIRILRQDATALDLPVRDIRFAALPFNMLMLIIDAEAQRRTLTAVARHLAPGGTVALDVMNPLTLPLEADRTPSPSEPRRNPRNGNSYIRRALADALDDRQCQHLHGWYEELLPDGSIRKTDFAFTWRMIFRSELQRIMEEAGLTPESIAGDFQNSPWTVESRRIVVTARYMA
jgi:SAM-dependent methyltransferase